MALRLVQVILPQAHAPHLRDLVALEPRGGPWQETLEDGLTCTRLLVEGDESSDLVDEIERRFGNVPGFHLLLLPVTTALPRPKEDETEAPRRFGTKRGGLTREELRDEGFEMARPDGVFFATVVLSTIVVATGLVRGNAAVIIGAMVIAPLLGPSVALALGTTLGDTRMMTRALVANLAGVALALAITVLLGAAFHDRPFSPEILARVDVSASDVLVALAAGSAGALALTTGVASALVGVMVAVALLPPTAVVGLALGRGALHEAGQAGLLLAVNLLSVNLAATATFLLQGIRPRRWWEADRARRASMLALAIGGVLLAALATLIFLTQR